MTPEEIEAFRGWCRTFEVPPYSLIMKALTHIDQQATSLAATEERVREHEAHENQTHEVLGGILGTDDTLENVARRAVDRITELESQIIHQTGISACRIEERERMQKQIAALKEIAIGERAGFLHYRASCYDPGRRCPYAKGCDDCTGWDTCSALDRFNADAIRQLSEEHPEAFR